MTANLRLGSYEVQDSASRALLQVGQRALRWVQSNVHRFSILNHHDDLLLVQEIKPVAELALTCDLMRRTKAVENLAPNANRVADEILVRCWEELKKGEALRRLLVLYPDLFSLITVYPPFWRAGLRNQALERVIESLSGAPGVLALEFPAWRVLDFALALRAQDRRSPWPVAQTFKNTWLGRHPWPWLLSDNAAYSVTHTVFYMTDFGRKPRGLPARARAYISRWCPVWCDYYARAKNLDLLAEFIMVSHCLGICATPKAARYLLGEQKRNGSVPGPVALEEMLNSAATTSTNTRFLLHYHTTLVALMAAVLCAQRQCRPE